MKNIIKQLLREGLYDNKYTLYCGTNKDLENDIPSSIWLSSTKEYASLWGENIYTVNIKLNNVFDATDIGNKKINYKQLKKYLISKGVNDSESINDMERDNAESMETRSFWWWLTQSGYTWLSHDILNSNIKYDAIKLTEYGFKKWGFQYTEDIIYAIDKEDKRNEFIPFGKEEIHNYREFVFIDNKPVFK